MTVGVQTDGAQSQTDPVDILIMGGGLAGLTLALQLRERFPDRQIRIIERNSHPAPDAAHKIGESTVEIGAHYLSEVLGLKGHLQSEHLKKFGFRFFFSEGRRDIDKVTEVGASRALPTPSYQIDRGRFETYLGTRAIEQRIEFFDDAQVRHFEMTQDDDALHTVHWTRQGQEHTTQARWLIDASGRAALIKRKLGLSQQNEHNAHAIWFRIKGHIKIDDWSDNPQWQARCTPNSRWLSTNHLVGTGYWVWLIPLASGNHSVGIVADPRHHALSEMNNFENTMQWLEKYQPALFDALENRRNDLMDFAFFKSFSYGCKQVFSPQRWALAGEAGLFLDPFYSPGTDFIGISNTFTTELIARDFAGESLGAHSHVFNQIYQSMYESTLALYQDQYAIFGDPEVLPQKIVWDYTYYWSVLSQLFFQGRLSDIRALSHLRDELGHCRDLNVAMQNFLREWSLVSDKNNPPVMHDQAEIDWFAELNRSLTDDLDDAQFHARLQQSCEQLTRLANEMIHTARSTHPALDASAVEEAIANVPVPYSPELGSFSVANASTEYTY